MQTVSRAWKENQKRNLVSEAFLEISIEVGDPDAQAGAVCTDNGHEPFSQVQSITDETPMQPIKYAALEPGLWVLDGTHKLLEAMEPPPPIIMYTVSANVEPAGSGTVTGMGTVEDGTEITLTAIPEDGCVFSGWQENGEMVSDTAEYTLAVSCDRILTAVFTVLPRDYPYSGDVVQTMLPAGKYKLEVWGAQGGYRNNTSYGGKGGYACGELTLSEPTLLFARSGGAGNTGGAAGGFNGGGKRSSHNGGGGASDIRIGVDDLNHRVIVGGGGGSDGAANKAGGYGGGESGQARTDSYGTGGFAGTQTGVSNTSWQTDTPSENTAAQEDAYAGFGFGGNGISASNGHGGAGGGGWYGGSGTKPDSSGDDDRGGGGGSGFVWTGNAVPDGFALDAAYQLENTQLLNGNQKFLSPENVSETGHSGDGYVRITPISET